MEKGITKKVEQEGFKGTVFIPKKKKPSFNKWIDKVFDYVEGRNEEKYGFVNSSTRKVA